MSDKIDRMWRHLMSMAAMLLLGATSFVVTACGGDDSGSPPTVDQATITCESVEDMGYEVVQRVSVRVTDPDADLKIPGDGIQGALGSTDIRLTDQDADAVFTWTPPTEMNDPPRACFGTFTLTVTARDAAGNVTEFSTTIDKGGDSQQ